MYFTEKTSLFLLASAIGKLRDALKNKPGSSSLNQFNPHRIGAFRSHFHFKSYFIVFFYFF